MRKYTTVTRTPHRRPGETTNKVTSCFEDITELLSPEASNMTIISKAYTLSKQGRLLTSRQCFQSGRRPFMTARVAAQMCVRQAGELVIQA